MECPALTKLKAGDKWLRDFGWGLTEDPEKAHDFTSDEALALCKLDDRYEVDGLLSPTVIHGKGEPDIPPGHDMVWIKYRGVWLVAPKQALFMGTREALKRATAQTSLIVEEEPA